MFLIYSNTITITLQLNKIFTSSSTLGVSILLDHEKNPHHRLKVKLGLVIAALKFFHPVRLNKKHILLKYTTLRFILNNVLFV